MYLSKEPLISLIGIALSVIIIILISIWIQKKGKAEKIIASVGAEKLAELMRPLIGEGAIPSIIAMLGTMTVLRQINLITGASNIPVTKEQLMDLNAQLNQIAIV